MPHKDPAVRKAYVDKYYQDNRQSYYWKNMRNRFGLTPELFHTMLEEQDYKCKLCKEAFKSFRKNDLHTDHCHETNKLRGLLCMKCNVGLGMLGDNEEGLLKALSYVRGESNE